MNKRYKTRMVGRWLPVALISLVLLVTPSMASPIMNKTARLPSGMIGSSNIDMINQSNPLFETYLNQIQPSQGNGQLRQSFFLGLSPYYRDANTLSGHTEYFLFYFPMTTVHYNSVLNGTVYFIFTDGSTYTYPWKITFNWWSNEIGLPLILYMSWSFSWIYKSCKAITCDLTYYEDGLFCRHVLRTFMNRGDAVSVPVNDALDQSISLGLDDSSNSLPGVVIPGLRVV